MPKVRITPNSTYTPGHVNTLLSQVAPGPIALEKDGAVTVKLTDSQLDEFHRRGGAAHKVEVLPESDPISAVAEVNPETTVAEVAVPGREPVMEYIDQCRAHGMSDQEIIDAMVASGWKESQAIDKVMNDQ